MSIIPLLSAEFLKLMLYIQLSLALFFGDAYLSTIVQAECLGVSHSCSEIHFVGTNLKFQKALVMLMAKTQKPVTFTIGRFAPLSINSVFTVIKAAFSYFMLVQSFKKEEQGN
ncbi:odorant receptor 59b-like [Photinus pyralis]|uniref:odorant receptor 59b-like n=1 Tax=Photinus pyralis TaxID=7054 RepID=UPI00126737EA|nr:odorant receptor 59b-like [Photinus pyralis]XP_031339241.1 odorant receptor 59b-like [Photinus pyralis]